MAWIGVLCVLPSVILATRLIWEQTVLSIQNGPQMVGFSLAHSPLGILLFLGPVAGAVWSIAAIVVIVRRRSWHDPIRLGLLGAFGLCILLMTLPYGFWQRLLAGAHAHGPYVGEYVSYAAATGDLATVKAFLAQGVSVNVRNEHDGATPLHAAAVEGQTAVINYLLSKGADVNALNAYADSPLQDAISMNRADAMAVLKAHGGENIRGSEAQRRQAIKDEVDGDIKRMDRQR